VNELPSVGVVVVNYNSEAFVGEFLESASRIDYPAMRLVVVDSASTDDSLCRITQRFPDAVVVRPGENLGTAGGNNLGAAACHDANLDYILFLNNDTTHEPNFLRILVQASDSKTMTVPRILYSEDRRVISTHAGDFDWGLGLFRNTHHGGLDGPSTRQRRQLQTASFCCLLMPAQAFRDAGPLDERFFMYYEETDLLKRALDRGYRLLYVPESIVYHRESASSGGGWMTPFKLYYATRNRPYLVKKNLGSPAAYARFTLYFWLTRVPQMGRLAVRREWKLLNAMLLGMVDYYRGRMGRTRQVQDF
jgi:GT2 family glycosyltransferase